MYIVRSEWILTLPTPDEVSCALFEVDASYIKESAPPQGSNEPGRNDSSHHQRDKTPVTVDIDLLSILEISEVDGHVSLQFDLRFTW